MTDFLGRSIKLGDEIVYAVRNGSTLKLTYARVIDFGYKHAWTGKPFPYIEVLPTRDKNDWRTNNPVKLSRSEYIVIVDTSELVENV